MKKNLKKDSKVIHPNKIRVFENIWYKLSPLGGVRIIFMFRDKSVILEAKDLINALRFKKRNE